MFAKLYDIDTTAFLIVNRSFSHWSLDRFFMTVTEFSHYIPPMILALFFFLRIDWKKTLAVAALAATTLALTDTLCSEVLKPLFNRPRPCNPELMVQGARCLAGLKSSLSFPSAHATNIFALATLLALLYPAGGFFFFAFAGIIGLSRVYIGVHYPLDVVGGAIAGSVVASGVYAAYRLLKNRCPRAPV